MPHKIGGNVTVFSVDGTNVLADIPNATLLIEGKTQQSNGLGTIWEDNEITGKRWQIDFDYEILNSAIFASELAVDGYVIVDFNTGANRYQGNGAVKTADHKTERDAMQMQKITILGRGSLTIT